jgi:hypothetical protein
MRCAITNCALVANHSGECCIPQQKKQTSQRTMDTFFKPATATNVTSLPDADSKSTEKVTVIGLTNCNVFCIFADACLCPNFQVPESDRVTWRAYLISPTISSPLHRPRSPHQAIFSQCEQTILLATKEIDGYDG